MRTQWRFPGELLLPNNMENGINLIQLPPRPCGDACRPACWPLNLRWVVCEVAGVVLLSWLPQRKKHT